MQHDDDFELSHHHSSSFDWREVNYTFFENGIQLYAEDFTVDEVNLYYLKKLPVIHNAEDFGPGQYQFGDEILQGSQDSILPPHTHLEVIDIAVLVATGDISSQDYQLKLNQVQINKLI